MKERERERERDSAEGVIMSKLRSCTLHFSYSLLLPYHAYTWGWSCIPMRR